MNFWNKLKRAWRIATQEWKYIEAYDANDAWTVEDVNIMRAFINTATGQKLMQRMVNKVFKTAFDATDHPNEAQYHVGIARGVALTVASFQEHFIRRFVGNEANTDTTKPRGRRLVGIE